jgi:hypothetical protein
MLEKETEHQSAGRFAWYASRDARMKSAVNASRFTEAQKVKAERVKLGLEMVYSCEKVTIDYCLTWVRVKVHKGTVRDNKNLSLLEGDWGQQGVVKVLTPQSIIYRVA